MKIITIGTLKGGVGKSNFAFNLGGILAEKGKKVLLIDGDPQGNLTLNAGVDILRAKYTIKNIFEEKEDIQKIIIKRPIEELPTLDVIASDILFYETEIKIISKAGREYILGRYFQNNLEIIEKYDYIIIDTNPSFSITNQNAFLVADEIILMSDVSLNGIQGAELLIAMYENVSKELGLENNINTLILNNVDRRIKLSRELIEYCKENKDIKDKIIETIIYNNKKFKDTEIEHKPINILYPKSEQNEIYKEVYKELKYKGVL